MRVADGLRSWLLGVSGSLVELRCAGLTFWKATTSRVFAVRTTALSVRGKQRSSRIIGEWADVLDMASLAALAPYTMTTYAWQTQMSDMPKMKIFGVGRCRCWSKQIEGLLYEGEIPRRVALLTRVVVLHLRMRGRGCRRIIRVDMVDKEEMAVVNRLVGMCMSSAWEIALRSLEGAKPMDHYVGLLPTPRRPDQPSQSAACGR